MSKRGRAWRRYKNYTKAKRKRYLDFYNIYWWHQKYSNNPLDFSGQYVGYYDNLHQYSKNKIHCSCPMCSAKTTNKRAKKVFYAPSWNPTMTDLRKEMAMDEDELEYLADAVFREKFSSRHNRRSRRR